LSGAATPQGTTTIRAGWFTDKLVAQLLLALDQEDINTK
jgi:hypothetical protein